MLFIDPRLIPSMSIFGLVLHISSLVPTTTLFYIIDLHLLK